MSKKAQEKIKQLSKEISVLKSKEKIQDIEKGQESKIKTELKALQEQKQSVPSGFKGFFIKAGINKQINERRKVLTAGLREQQAKALTKQVRTQTELEKAKLELKEVKAKNRIDFDVFGDKQGSKAIKTQDIFGY